MDIFSGISSVDIEIFTRCVLQILLLSAAAVFSGSEAALFSLSRIDLQHLRNIRHPESDSIHALLDEPRRLIISLLCGNELVNIASVANMTAILLLLFERDTVGWLNIFIMVPLLLLFGEVTPKTIAVNHPIRFATRLTARVLPKWIILITPIRIVVRLIADRITTWIVGKAVNRENILQPDELRTLLEESEETGVIDATERVLMDNVLEAAEIDISHILTPSVRINFIDANASIEEIIEQFKAYKHPRVPVYADHWDNVIGFLHSEDILRMLRHKHDVSKLKLDSLLKPVHFVPPTKTVDEMFEYFQAHKTRAAVVLGEYGEVLGIVTVRDVLTFLFGEVSGRMRGQEYYREEDDNSYLVPGDMRLTDFYNLTNFDIEDPVMTTIGGVAFRLFDRLPEAGDSVFYEGYEFVAKEVKGLRISQLLVKKAASEANPSDNNLLELPHLDTPSTTDKG